MSEYQQNQLELYKKEEESQKMQMNLANHSKMLQAEQFNFAEEQMRMQEKFYSQQLSQQENLFKNEILSIVVDEKNYFF
jgi:pantothenate kinase-related protein Tda10